MVDHGIGQRIEETDLGNRKRNISGVLKTDGYTKCKEMIMKNGTHNCQHEFYEIWDKSNEGKRIP